ncbi:MAG: FecR family protein [Rhodospirillales bacterium]|nr:FecR family protein [Rhodospirillales bacterium]
MRVLPPFLWMCVIVSMAFALPAGAETVGAVERARGETSASQMDQTRVLSDGSAVQVDDVLRTGAGSRLYVTFIDDTRLMLGDRSEIVIDSLVYSPDQSGPEQLSPEQLSMGALRLTHGVFRMVSGQVNKVPGGALVIATPMATIGVRGTDFWGEQSADQLLMALLDDGELTLTTAQGSVTLTDPKTAVLIHAGEAPGPVFTLTDQQLQDALATIGW